MIRKKTSIVIICLLTLFSARAQVDKKATAQTVKLYNNLHKAVAHGIMFGHHDDLAYGLNANLTRWQNEPGRSDVKTVTGDYPAVYGWEIGGLEEDDKRNIDGIDFNDMRRYIQEGYQRGGIITISWHPHNPVTGKTTWDKTGNVVKDIIPGGSHHAHYKKWLDKVAVFLASLKGKKGEPIPVLFRPYHELTGSWFWWGKDLCTPQQLIALWRFTVGYMNSEKGLHNLLFVYNTSDVQSEAAFLERYPGNDYADMMSVDSYCMDAAKFGAQLTRSLDVLKAVAGKNKKLMALAETGFERIPQANWWTATLWKNIAAYPLSYVLVWRNGRADHYYAPFQGQSSAADFIRFYAMPKVVFGKKLQALNIYQ